MDEFVKEGISYTYNRLNEACHRVHNQSFTTLIEKKRKIPIQAKETKQQTEKKKKQQTRQFRDQVQNINRATSVERYIYILKLAFHNRLIFRFC